MTTLGWGTATDVGRVRTNNEDSALTDEPLFAVADGVGGHAAGEVASSVAIEAFRAAAPGGLTEAVLAANQAVLDRADADAALRGMGTTLVALTIHHAGAGDGAGDEVEIVNVGDSRCYLLRDGALSQVTDDHNVPGELLREGRLTVAEARVHPQKNIVTRSLGRDLDVEVDRFVVDPFRGDRFLLCSDGLFDELTDDEIANVLRRVPNPQDAADELVLRAREAGGRDNITVVLVDVVDDDDRSGVASSRLTAGGAGRAAPTVALHDDDGGSGGTGSDLVIEPPLRRRRLTWRSAAFLLAVALVLAAAIGSFWWFGRGSYYVGLDGKDEVTIFQGRPGGLLWVKPTVARRTHLALEELPADTHTALRDGKTEPSEADAEAYVRRLQRTSTTTTSTTSTTTVPEPTTTSTPAPTP